MLTTLLIPFLSLCRVLLLMVLVAVDFLIRTVEPSERVLLQGYTSTHYERYLNVGGVLIWKVRYDDAAR